MASYSGDCHSSAALRAPNERGPRRIMHTVHCKTIATMTQDHRFSTGLGGNGIAGEVIGEP
jgi:hypothetical protein